MKALVVVDVQNDFVSGSLGTKEAQEMLPRLMKKVEAFEGALFVTLDTHGEDYLQTQEGHNLPVVHCVRGTWGWELPAELSALTDAKGATVFEKPCFGSVRLAEELVKLHASEPLESIELVGLCTDICVVSNALMIKAALPEVPVLVDASCCAGVTPEKHEAALVVMESCQVAVTR